MLEYPISAAKEAVKARLDEIAFSASDMLGSAQDDRNLDLTIEKLLPEAIESVHLAAPYALMEGIKVSNAGVPSPPAWSDNNGVVSIALHDAEIPDFLRLVSFHCYIDSDVVLTEAVPENSQTAKLQLNKYMRGTPQAPVLVLADSVFDGSTRYYSEDSHPCFKYYTCHPAEGEIFEFNLVFFPKAATHQIAGTTPAEYAYYISTQLKTAVENYLTALVLQTYKSEYAKVFFDRAADNLK